MMNWFQLNTFSKVVFKVFNIYSVPFSQFYSFLLVNVFGLSLKNLTILFFISCSFLLIGCSTISSSMHYTRGTEHLNCGNFSEAIVELEQAVKLDSSRARYHTNLAGAYFGNNDIDKTWYHCRQAVRCPYDDGISKSQFLKFYEILIVESGLNAPGTSSQKILESLGQPDETWRNEKGETLLYMYGICAMSFSDGRLTKCNIW